MDGVLLVDKPEGWTSHDVCQFVKKRFRVKKVGHAGTLDPCATGLLVLLVGQMTKMSAFFSSQKKSYEGIMILGAKTDTQDKSGRIVGQNSFEHVRAQDILSVFASFLGVGEQLPPMASAIKHNGVALYRLFRKGEEVERKTRPITVYSLDVTSIKLPNVDFSCTVSKGTYVRTLVHDAGEHLGCYAHLGALRRTSSGSFSVSQCVKVDTLRGLSDTDRLRQYFQKVQYEDLHALTA